MGRGVPFLVSFLCIAAQAAIYDRDDRFDLYQVPGSLSTLKIAPAVALVTRKAALEEMPGKTFKVVTRTLADYQLSIEEPLCTTERFQSQPLIDMSAGSGFLASSQVLVTAGHVADRIDCDSMVVIFDFALFSPGTDPTQVSSDNVYYCKRVIQSVNQGDIDFAVVTLDRPVKNRAPLRIASHIPKSVGMVGHPMALPMKVTGAGPVIRESTEDYFRAKLDTFPGNSGGPVIDPVTGEVVGILVEGETGTTTMKDLPEGGSCWYEKVFCDDKKTSIFACDDDEYSAAKISRSSQFLPLLLTD